MHSIRITKLLALVQAGFVVAAVCYVTMIYNAQANTDFLVFALTVLPPVLAAWIGARLARGRHASQLLALGQAVGVTAYVLAFFSVVSSSEPLAPLLLVLVAFWQAMALAVLLLVVWLVGSREDKPSGLER